MGKLSLVVVIGFATIVGIVGTSMNKRTRDAHRNNASLYEKTQARNIAKSGAQIYARKLKENPDYSGTLNLSLNGGQVTVGTTEKVPGKRDKLGLSSDATYGGATYGINADAIDDISTFPTATGALGISYLSKAKIKLGKGANIDGNNYGLNGIASSAFPAVAGLSLGHPDQTSGLDYKPKDVTIKGKGAVDPNIEIQAPQLDYYAWAMKLAQGADVVYNSRDVKSVETLGTLADPQVTYVKGHTKFNEQITGAGVLIIDGSCKFNKTIDFVGLVFVVGDSLTSEKATMGKGSSIIGAMMVAGKKTSVTIGDADLLYSAEAVNQGLGLVASHMPRGYVFSNWR
jgi:hypothetical protein